jgi:hypothetical protein
MDKFLSKNVFAANLSGVQRLTHCYAQKRAGDIGFKESWLQGTIAQNPELVLGPCRQAGFIPQDEQWRYLRREVAVKDAQGIIIDVLLVSELGRQEANSEAYCGLRALRTSVL